MGIPSAAGIVEQDGEAATKAFEQTGLWMTGKTFAIGLGNVVVTPELLAFAESMGVSEEDLRAFLSAALTENIPPDIMLGFADVESDFCRNIGQYSAYEQANNRLNSEIAKGSSAATIAWWIDQVVALEQIASELGVDVMSIPGSFNAGAISCFQIMPGNWVRYGSGDYRITQLAALYATRHLNETGFQTDPIEAIRKYNPGDPTYVGRILAAAALWTPYIQGVGITELEKPPSELGFLHAVAIWSEFYAANKLGGVNGSPPGGPIVPIPIGGKFVFPLPDGFTANGYGWWAPVYVWDPIEKKLVLIRYHPGIDWIAPMGGPIVAAHNGTVVLARYISTGEALAGKWWISGNVVVIRAELEDGTALCTLYGHGLDGSIAVSVGQDVDAGQEIMKVDATGWSNSQSPISHLHFALIIGGSGDTCEGGQFVNPGPYLP